MTSSRRLRLPRDHPKKEVREALKKILALTEPVSFELVKGGHWGTLVCSNGCCRIPVNGTPQNPGRHARDLTRETGRCPRPDGDVRKGVTRP